MSARLLRFGVFELDLVERKLRRRGYVVALPPQPFAVLASSRAAAAASSRARSLKHCSGVLPCTETTSVA